MKKLLASLLIALTVLGFAFAGGKQQASSGKIELNFLEVMTSPGRTEVLKGMIAEYEKSHPNVTINLISPPYEQADSRLAMSLNAQEPLDVVEVRDLTVTGYVNNGWLTDLTSYFNSWNEASSLLSVTKEAATAVGGKPYFVPQWFMIKALFLRTDILAKLGVSKNPETQDELYALAKRITNPAQNQFGFTLRGKGNPFKSSDPLIISDVSNVDIENLYKLKNGTSVYDSPEFLAGLKSYVDLYKNATPSDSINWGFNEQINAFVSGITPILVQDPDTVPLLDESLSRDQYTVIPMPKGRSNTSYLDYGYAGYGIPNYSKNKDAAWEFIAFLSSYSQNSAFCKAYGALPIHTTSYTSDPYFSTGVYQAWQKEMNTPGLFTFIKYPYDSPKFAGWAQIQEQYIQSTLLGQTTPEQAAKAWADYWK
ncbi:ABC transporter substrate-binding protein [Leadbettera azotonutricia]|uniref:Extracellular solute-binding protein family 1 n=1 Tax=Leadbettera azotonutricia (strain ATCC BAA-888 / DSM 13862 / ZAS-9) TaxID=545695 RepID=F5YEC7_LEAAZ|nr:sugar ABC transporter substrate-binding protein [Leadbettera azotonutricia]AEF80388.1 extracellular solute-binding protein family 1 [Leadbettera azotonutricia ZAS-9]